MAVVLCTGVCPPLTSAVTASVPGAGSGPGSSAPAGAGALVRAATTADAGGGARHTGRAGPSVSYGRAGFPQGSVA